MRASDRKSKRTTAQEYADLAKLGKYLSASEVRNPSRAKVAKQRQGALVDQYRASVGGGQGKAVPTSRIVTGPSKDKSTYRMTAQQKRGSFAKNSYDGTWNVSARKKPGK